MPSRLVRTSTILAWLSVAVTALALLVAQVIPLVTYEGINYDRDGFVGSIAGVVSTAALIVFFMLIGQHRIGPYLRRTATNPESEVVQAQDNSSGRARSWLAGMLAAIVFVAGTIVIVNPRDLYGPRIFPAWVHSPQHVKPPAYLALDETPDIVILGSSRAFTIMPSSVQQKLGLSAFNATVGGGRTSDALTFARFMANNRDHRLPEVLLIEVGSGFSTRPDSGANVTPFSMVPYMDFRAAQTTVWDHLEGLLGFQQFGESFYVLRFQLLRSQDPALWTFDERGGGIDNFPPVLKADLLGSAELFGPESTCLWLTPDGKSQAQELIELAQEHGTSIIFYIPPRHPSFYELRIRDNPLFPECSESFLKYVHHLTRQYDNIFFLDYTILESIHGVRNARGFYDSQHMTPYNNDLLIDAASDTIVKAYQAAVVGRARQP